MPCAPGIAPVVVAAVVAERARGLFFHGAPSNSPFRRPHAVAPARSAPPPQTETHEFFRWVFGRLNLAIERYRPAALHRRMPACLRFLGVQNLVDARERIEARPTLALELMDVVLLGVSEFWRDPTVFEVLRTIVAPRTLQRAPHPRIWSAACSEGQELYSVAAMLAVGDALERCELRGTDCRPEAIARARLGEYPRSVVARLTPQDCKGLFVAQGDRVRVHPRLRTAVTWKVADLLKQHEPGPWDLILWRNMAIYLEQSAAEEIWWRLIDQLVPGGFIVVGKADYPPPRAQLERVAPCVYAKPQ